MKLKSFSIGFSLMELTLVLALFLLLLGGAMASLSAFYANSQQGSYSADVVQSLRRAQANSLSRYQNSPWGVNLDTAGNQFILFKGTTYATRDTSFDEITKFPSSLAFQNIALSGGGTQIVFAMTTGKTAGGSFDVVDTLRNRHTVITLNSYGQIEVQ